VYLQRRLRAQLLHNRTGTDEVRVRCKLVDIFADDFGLVSPRPEMPPNHRFKFFSVQRLHQNLLRAELGRFFSRGHIIRMAKRYDRKIGAKPTQPAQNVQALGVAAGKIEQ